MALRCGPRSSRGAALAAGRLAWPGRAARLFAAALLLAPLTPALGLTLRQEAQRGLEDHSARLLLGQSLAGPRDSLRLDLRAEWRSGFRDYNRDSRRLYEQALLDGTRLLDGPWRLRWGLRQSVFNERRSLRETLATTAEAGLRRVGPLDAELLAGWLQDRRQTGYDSGPRLRLGLGAKGKGQGWDLSGKGAWQAEQPGRRRSSLTEAGLLARWRGPEEASDELRLLARNRREDVFPDPLDERLEHRSGVELEFENHFRGRPGIGTLRADLLAWSRDQDRRPRGRPDSLRDTRGALLDRGLELRADQRLRLGAVEGVAGLLFRRQQQDAEYGPLDRVSRTLSAIAQNRLEAQLAWLPRADSLLARGAVELRRRDTDFSGPARRDPDYMDQARREGLLRWSRSRGPGARLGLEAGLTLNAERHQQASRSRANYLNRTWRAASDHRLGLGRWVLTGGGALVADYRLYDFDDAERPRSWIQRRLQWEERARRALAAEPAGWRTAGELGMRWMEEDGGSYLRGEGLERISDSAREWRLGATLEGRRGAWTVRPGWSWLERRDWRWSGGEGGRERGLARELRRQGPLLAAARRGSRGALRLDLQWEWARERAAAGSVNARRSLWVSLDWSLFLP